MDGMRDITSEIGMSRDGNRPRRELLLEIANAIVGVHKDCYGKGPTKAKAYYQGDVVTCVLRGGYTRAEHTLIGAGQTEAVDHGRRMLQLAARDKFISAIEEITGRKVIGFMSGSQQDPEMSAEVFVLESQDSSSPSHDSGS
jgi:uncharacterized protein YbcI